MPSPIIERLRSSRLIEASEAAAAAEAGAPVELLGDPFEISEALGRTYQARATVATSRGDTEGDRLDASLFEFSGNLMRHVGESARWSRIGNRHAWHFLCCALSSRALVIGCMRVREGGPINAAGCGSPSR
jgi:hypothetical protein